MTTRATLDVKLEGEDDSQEKGLMSELGRHYMILFGSNPNFKEFEWFQWVLLIGFTFLMNIMNLNLLISIIGATFDKVQ